MREAVIVSTARTPLTKSHRGEFNVTPAAQLAAFSVKAAVERAGIAGEKVDRVYMGCVLPAGLGQAPARQAALGAQPVLVQAHARHIGWGVVCLHRASVAARPEGRQPPSVARRTVAAAQKFRFQIMRV